MSKDFKFEIQTLNQYLVLLEITSGISKKLTLVIHMAQCTTIYRPYTYFQLSHFILVLQEAQIKHNEVLILMASNAMEDLETGGENETEQINIVKNLLYLLRWEKSQSGKKASRYCIVHFIELNTLKPNKR